MEADCRGGMEKTKLSCQDNPLEKESEIKSVALTRPWRLHEMADSIPC